MVDKYICVDGSYYAERPIGSYCNTNDLVYFAIQKGKTYKVSCDVVVKDDGLHITSLKIE